MWLHTTRMSYKKILFCKMKHKNKEDKKIEPYFEAKQKNDASGNYEILDSRENTITGYLTEIENKTYEYDKKTIEIFSLTFFDPKENLYIIFQANFSWTTRSMLSALAWADFQKEISLVLYRSQKWFLTLAVKQENDLLSWSHDFSSLRNKYVKEKINAKGELDWHDYCLLDDFFKSLVDEISEKNLYPDPNKNKEYNNEQSNGKPEKNDNIQDNQNNESEEEKQESEKETIEENKPTDDKPKKPKKEKAKPATTQDVFDDLDDLPF